MVQRIALAPSGYHLGTSVRMSEPDEQSTFCRYFSHLHRWAWGILSPDASNLRSREENVAGRCWSLVFAGAGAWGETKSWVILGGHLVVKTHERKIQTFSWNRCLPCSLLLRLDPPNKTGCFFFSSCGMSFFPDLGWLRWMESVCISLMHPQFLRWILLFHPLEMVPEGWNHGFLWRQWKVRKCHERRERHGCWRAERFFLERCVLPSYIVLPRFAMFFRWAFSLYPYRCHVTNSDCRMLFALLGTLRSYIDWHDTAATYPAGWLEQCVLWFLQQLKAASSIQKSEDFENPGFSNFQIFAFFLNVTMKLTHEFLYVQMGGFFS